ncbi:hypothetical protein RN001_011918 [Aquatica leii]|uniref:Uncharacterized protein n=1 Tax=Aquatica leii TaxID=1421715 RepID=A0AAN7P6K1_9COLE|nr:hypothetical protein RN001_011918 [Aquatica leii]
MLPPFTNMLSKNHWSVFFGTSAFMFGLVILFFKTWFIEILTASVIVLRPNTILENLWKKSPIEVPTSVYFFNWTNPEAIRDFNVKPKFEEVGPYIFNQYLEKTNIVWNDNNDTVTYVQLRTFSYDDQNPNSNLADKITSLNVVTMAGSHYIQNWNYFFKRAVSVFLSAVYPNVDITRTASQLLLEGYEDVIVAVANYLPFIASEVPRFNKFGWLFILNGTDEFEGAINMETGKHGTFNVRQWNYNNSLPQFDGSCSKLHGSAGELYPHKITPDYINVFIPQICRVVKMQYEQNVLVDGILGYKFVIGNSTLDNGDLIPENKCFCSGQCIPSGVFNISSCRYGLPAYGSLPNFYSADSFYLNKIDGMKPNKEKHESYIILETTTGIPLKATLRLQLNILLHPISNIAIYEDVPEVYIPVLWVEVTANLPNTYKTLLKIYLAGPLILSVVSVVLVLTGLYLLLFVAYKPAFVSLYKQIYMKKRSNSVCPEEVPLQNDVETAFSKDKCEWKQPIIGTFTMR